MSDLEVIVWKDENDDTYSIKLCKKKDRKKGLVFRVTEEWLEKHMQEVPEGAQYPRKRVVIDS